MEREPSWTHKNGFTSDYSDTAKIWARVDLLRVVDEWNNPGSHMVSIGGK